MTRNEQIEAELRKPDGMVILTAEEMRELVTTYTEPTMGLRFVNGRLQQAFEVRRYQDCRPLSRSIEWRDVPSVDLADATKKPTP